MDPFTIATEALEKYLIDSPSIRRVMKSGIEKRVDAFITTRSTKDPDTYSESDLPRIRLIPQMGESSVRMAAGLANITMNYEVGVVSGDKRFSHDLFPLVFALYAACTKAVHSSDLCGLTWQGKSFIKDIGLSDIQTGFATAEGKGIFGTSSVCTLTLFMYFPTALLVAWDS